MEAPRNLASQSMTDVQARGPFSLCIVATTDELDGKCRSGLEVKRYGVEIADFYDAQREMWDMLRAVVRHRIPVHVLLTDRERHVLTDIYGMLL